MPNNERAVEEYAAAAIEAMARTANVRPAPPPPAPAPPQAAEAVDKERKKEWYRAVVKDLSDANPAFLSDWIDVQSPTRVVRFATRLGIAPPPVPSMDRVLDALALKLQAYVGSNYGTQSRLQIETMKSIAGQTLVAMLESMVYGDAGWVSRAKGEAPREKKSPISIRNSVVSARLSVLNRIKTTNESETVASGYVNMDLGHFKNALTEGPERFKEFLSDMARNSYYQLAVERTVQLDEEFDRKYELLTDVEELADAARKVLKL